MRVRHIHYPLRLALGIVLLFQLAAGSAQARNKFPIWAFADNPGIVNKTQFYQWVDDWGAKYYYVGKPDSVAAWFVLGSCVSCDRLFMTLDATQSVRRSYAI